MKESLLVILLGFIMFSCGTREYRCSGDNIAISNIRQAYVIRAINEYDQDDSLSDGIVEYEIVVLKDQAQKDRIAVESYALANEGRIYCCEECAKKAKAALLQQAEVLE